MGGAPACVAAEGGAPGKSEDRGGEAEAERWLTMIVIFGGEERRESERCDRRADFEEDRVVVLVGRSRATERRAS